MYEHGKFGISVNTSPIMALIVLLSQSTKSRTAQTYFLICFTCGNTIGVTSGTNGATKWKCPGIGCTHLALTTSFFTVYTWQVSSDKFFTANITTFGIAGWSGKINKKIKVVLHILIVESYYHKILVSIRILYGKLVINCWVFIMIVNDE